MHSAERKRKSIYIGKSHSTGCKSDIWKKVQVNILKELLLVQKQMLHQQKALNLCYLEPKGQGRGFIIRAWQSHRR